MSVKIGDVSGCLKVIPFSAPYEQEVAKAMHDAAEVEWHIDRQGLESLFGCFFKLTKEEQALYREHKEMPDSFVDKFASTSTFHAPFLYHKKKPNTARYFCRAYREKMLIKVKCTKCGRELLTDEATFRCVKWMRCLGAECNKDTVDLSADYTKSMFTWKNTNDALLLQQISLMEKRNLLAPPTYRNCSTDACNNIKIAYVSDIHLLHHARLYNNDINKCIRMTAKNLHASLREADIILFTGDTASEPQITVAFYRQFMNVFAYEPFVDFLDEIHKYQNIFDKFVTVANDEYTIAPYILKRRPTLGKRITSIWLKISDIHAFDSSTFQAYKQRYYQDRLYEEAFERYTSTKSYAKMHVCKKEETIIKHYLIDIDKCNNALSRMLECVESLESAIEAIKRIENEYGKSIKKITAIDFPIHQNYSEAKIGVVLGNHEFAAFDNIAQSVQFYKQQLENMGINLLHNSSISLPNKAIIYGGTGFAKYSETHNAQNTLCCRNFSRQDEIGETDKFEAGYQEALQLSRTKNIPLICAAHYPIESCFNGRVDMDVIYFTGHTHRNICSLTEHEILYADNQIGYKKKSIRFKHATVGRATNPYHTLPDGLYKTNIPDYLSFYRHIGETIGDGAKLYMMCANNRAALFVIKRLGFYGFFIITTKGQNKGISIVNGGNVKKITGSTDINWICENFDVVVRKYIHLLSPLRTLQNRLSMELKRLGLSGEIHGTIVDIDFYHHIMVNPMDGTITFYYSPFLGLVQEMDSFKEVMKSLCDGKENIKLRDKYNKMLNEDKANLLPSVKSHSPIKISGSTDAIIAKERNMASVDLSDGAYGVSRKISPLQRLFTGSVLRAFDLRLAETEQTPFRKNLLIGRRFYYDGYDYEVIEDTGRELIVARKLDDVSLNDQNPLSSQAETKSFAVIDIKDKIIKP